MSEHTYDPQQREWEEVQEYVDDGTPGKDDPFRDSAYMFYRQDDRRREYSPVPRKEEEEVPKMEVLYQDAQWAAIKNTSVEDSWQILHSTNHSSFLKNSMLIGRGRSSEVFKWVCRRPSAAASQHDEAEELYCVKVVTLDDQPPPHDVFKEIRALQRISHPNVAKLFMAGQEEVDFATTAVCLLMPYYGKPLSASLQSTTLFPAELADSAGLSLTDETEEGQGRMEAMAYLRLAKSVITQVLQALAHLHDEARIAHRDIKPENLMLAAKDAGSASTGPHQNEKVEREYQVKLIDFGTACELGERNGQPNSSGNDEENDEPLLLKTATAVATGVYRAPELLFSPQDGYDPRKVDVWATACVAADFFTGWEQKAPVQSRKRQRRDESPEVFVPSRQDGESEPGLIDDEFWEVDTGDARPWDSDYDDEEDEDEQAPDTASAYRRKNLFDVVTPSDIPLAADIFKIKGLPKDSAEWPEAARFRPPLDRMPFHRTPPSDMSPRIPLVEAYRHLLTTRTRTRDTTPARQHEAFLDAIVPFLKRCTELSAAKRPSASQALEMFTLKASS